ncbi:hypothetical protein [Roseovarius arcticus]|uniref:hypothetical protein n=1 Tax=Roseovarius arcticus TaxID=2547404 RepID=UPI0011109909|nr:hypothetical protein [Roseovarius arcticus]
MGRKEHFEKATSGILSSIALFVIAFTSSSYLFNTSILQTEFLKVIGAIGCVGLAVIAFINLLLADLHLAKAVRISSLPRSANLLAQLVILTVLPCIVITVVLAVIVAVASSAGHIFS